MNEYINKVINGDCIEVLKQLPENSVDLIVTSPPYNKHSANRKCGSSDSWQKANINYDGFDDNLDESVYQAQQREVLRECLRVLKRTGSIFYNHKARIIKHATIFPHEWLGGFIVRQMVVWNRKATPMLEPIRFMPITEYIFWITKERTTPKFNGEAFSYSEIWEIPAQKDNDHPAPFPIEIPLRAILSTTDKDDIVLDPYGGSGTTAVAAIRTNRNFILIEQSAGYCAIAEKRIKEERNKLAETCYVQDLALFGDL